MIKITYGQMLCFISVAYCLLRAVSYMKEKTFSLKREIQMILVYICIIVIARFVFFPFEKIDGQIQPLVFDPENAFPPKVNLRPFVHLWDYVMPGQANLNLIGNIAMFVPVGIIWPYVFRDLDNPVKAILAGAGYSVIIEILQLPFYDRVSDIDDIILNTAGYITGYFIYISVRKINTFIKRKKASTERL